MFISAVNLHSQQSYATKNLSTHAGYSDRNMSFGINYANLQQVKSDFAKEGIKYLMPNEIWTDSKIEKAINRLDKRIKALINNDKLTKRNIYEEINNILPANKKNSIKIYDTNDLKEYFIQKGYSEEDAEKESESCGGLQIHEDNVSKIFIPLKKFQADKNSNFNQLNLRMALAHELTHSLQTILQNNKNADEYHHKRLHLSQKYRKDFFNNFEEEFYPMFENDDVYDEAKKPSEKNFYKYIDVKNEKELFKNFDNAFKSILDTKYRYYSQDRHSTKQFFTFCKNEAHNEKMAYKTTSIMRGLHNDKQCPINYDYRSLLYEKMEKYFNSKAKTAQEAPECKREYKFDIYG